MGASDPAVGLTAWHGAAVVPAATSCGSATASPFALPTTDDNWVSASIQSASIQSANAAFACRSGWRILWHARTPAPAAPRRATPHSTTAWARRFATRTSASASAPHPTTGGARGSRPPQSERGASSASCDAADRRTAAEDAGAARRGGRRRRGRACAQPVRSQGARRRRPRIPEADTARVRRRADHAAADRPARLAGARGHPRGPSRGARRPRAIATSHHDGQGAGPPRAHRPHQPEAQAGGRGPVPRSKSRCAASSNATRAR